MPRKCSVAGCRSNYKNENEVHITTFSLPKTVELKNKWLRKIPTVISHLKEPQVCIKHFLECDIVRYDVCWVKGERKEFPRKIPKLKENAIPQIFPNLPKYLSNTPSSSKRLANVEEERFEKAVLDSIESYKEFREAQSISALRDILLYYEKSPIKKQWILINEDDKVYLCLLDLSEEIQKITGSIVIKNNLEFSVIINNEKLHIKKIPQSIQTLNSVSVLDDLLNFVECKSKNLGKNCHAQKDNIEKVCDILSELSVSEDSENRLFNFIIEQLNLYKQPLNNRRYTGDTLMFAASLYVHSSSTYMIVYESKCLYLPHPRNIKKLICKFSLTDPTIKGSINYLKTKMMYLKEHELLVNLHLDEIYVNSQLSFKNNTIFGGSEIDPSKIAKTVQVFMISSILSKYRDVVSLIPVNNLTGDQLKQLIFYVLKELEQIGFRVITLISDNNSVNRKAFALFAENKMLQPVVPHPLDNARLLFFIFDVVHIIKCIKNNWLNIRAKNCSFVFPNFDIHNNTFDTEVFLTADFKNLEILYEAENKSLIKLGHLLSYKVLYPTSVQKQNVKLALNVFNDKNVAALKCAPKNVLNQCNDVKGTCAFLEIFIKWWKICNVRSVYEGKRFNDKLREPIRAESHMSLDFLKKMSEWLKVWRSNVPISNSLSKETFTSLINTIDGFLLLIPYMFKNYKIDYLLLGKFENDILEGRFSSYRQLSGANYYVSLIQVLESEKKLRFKNTILFSCATNKIPLKSVIPSCNESYNSNINVDSFHCVLDKEFSLENIPKENLTIIAYIGGYAVRKQLRCKQCTICCEWLQSDSAVDVDIPHDLTLELDRGKLVLPSENALLPVAVAWHIMQTICDNEQLLNLFLSGLNQLSKLHKLCMILIHNYMSQTELNEKCDCKEIFLKKIEQINLTSCKIMLNNFVKTQNDHLELEKSKLSDARKIKKLKSS